VKIWRQAAEPIADLSAINPWRDRLASNPLVMREGFIEPNDEPGLGLTIDEDRLADYRGIAGSSYVPPRWACPGATWRCCQCYAASNVYAKIGRAWSRLGRSGKNRHLGSRLANKPA
jgi:hypothetical protein